MDCSVEGKTFRFWSKLLWRSLTAGESHLLVNNYQPCQHSQIAWKTTELLAYSCTTDVKKVFSCLLTRGRRQLLQNPFCHESSWGRCFFGQHSLQEGFHIRLDEWKIPTLVQLEPHSWWDNFSTSLWDHRNSCWAQMKKSVWVHRCARWRACCSLERQKEFSQVPSITKEVGVGRCVKSTCSI